MLQAHVARQLTIFQMKNIFGEMMLHHQGHNDAVFVVVDETVYVSDVYQYR